jgi:hypothetical protein
VLTENNIASFYELKFPIQSKVLRLGVEGPISVLCLSRLLQFNMSQFISCHRARTLGGVFLTTRTGAAAFLNGVQWLGRVLQKERVLLARRRQNYPLKHNARVELDYFPHSTQAEVNGERRIILSLVHIYNAYIRVLASLVCTDGALGTFAKFMAINL